MSKPDKPGKPGKPEPRSDKPRKQRRSGERRARGGDEAEEKPARKERPRKERAPQPEPEREEEATDALSDVRTAEKPDRDGAGKKGDPDRAEYSQTAAKLLRKLRKNLVLEKTGQVALEDRYLRLLGRIGDRAVPPLRDGLRDPRWEARYAAAAALHYLARKRYSTRVGDAVPELQEAVKDERPQVRAKALEALGTLRGLRDEVLPTIIKALGDESAEVSRAAVAQVLELSKDPRRTAKLMIKVLERRKNELARMGALMVLFHLGKEARDAVPHLLQLLEDDSPEIREYAHLALMGIRTPSMRLEIIRTSSMRLKVAEDGASASEPASSGTPDEDSLEEMDEEDSEPAADEDEEDEDEESEKRPRPRIPRRRKTRRRR